MNADADKNAGKKLGDLLRELRDAHGYSQDTVAEEAGIDRTTYSRYEKGRTPNAVVVAKIARLYGISTDSMLSVIYDDLENEAISVLGSKNKESRVYMLTEDEQLVMDYYRNSKRKEAIIDYAQNICLEDEKKKKENRKK